MTSMQGGGQALFSLVRFWSRRWLSPWRSPDHALEAQVQEVLVLEAISSFPKDRPVSIVDVAKSLAIDPSVASRMVAKATRHGLITKRRSQDDPRQVVLLVTSKGESVLSDTHAWQERVFADLTREWEPDDATRLAGYLARLLETLPRIDSAQPRE